MAKQILVGIDVPVTTNSGAHEAVVRRQQHFYGSSLGHAEVTVGAQFPRSPGGLIGEATRSVAAWQTSSRMVRRSSSGQRVTSN